MKTGLAIIFTLMIVLPVSADTRDDFIDRIVAITEQSNQWVCEAGDCKHFAYVKFIRRGRNVFVQSTVKAFVSQPGEWTAYRPVVLQRAMFLDLERMAFEFQTEYLEGNDNFPIVTKCENFQGEELNCRVFSVLYNGTFEQTARWRKEVGGTPPP